MKPQQTRAWLLALGLWATGQAAAAQSFGAAELAREPGERVLARYLASADTAALERAAEKGDVAASYLLFVLHDRDGGNPQAADRWLARLASTNTPAGTYAFALARYRKDSRSGRGVEIVDTTAGLTAAERQAQIAALESLAPQFPKAYSLLARIYRDGTWVPADPARANRYLQQGASAGVASALLDMAQSVAGQGGATAEVARLADEATTAGDAAGQVLGCAAYLELGRPQDALRRCTAAAEAGSPWGQLAAGELLARDPNASVDDARRYLSAAAGAADPAIADRAALALASLHVKAGAVAQAIAALEKAGRRDALAAWSLGRLHLEHKSDPATAERWLTQALALPGADMPAIAFDLARAVRARGGDWQQPLKRAADAGHAQAALALAFELQARSRSEARTYAQAAAKDPALTARARQLIEYLDKTAG